MIDKKHNLNEKNINLFINQYTEIRKTCARLLIENTHYIQTNKILKIINTLIDKLFSHKNFNKENNTYIYWFRNKIFLFFIGTNRIYYKYKI